MSKFKTSDASFHLFEQRIFFCILQLLCRGAREFHRSILHANVETVRVESPARSSAYLWFPILGHCDGARAWCSTTWSVHLSPSLLDTLLQRVALASAHRFAPPLFSWHSPLSSLLSFVLPPLLFGRTIATSLPLFLQHRHLRALSLDASASLVLPFLLLPHPQHFQSHARARLPSTFAFLPSLPPPPLGRWTWCLARG